MAKLRLLGGPAEDFPYLVIALDDKPKIRRQIIDGHPCYFRGDVCVIGPDDQTPEVLHYRNGRNTDEYDPECAACWLGHGHSQAYHQAGIENRGALSRLHDEERRRNV